MSNTKTVMGQASNQYVAPTDITDVFSTYLFKANNSTQTITNGIDLDGEGGMVWLKSRTNDYHHGIYDTARGATKVIYPSLSNAEDSVAGLLDSFNSDGFTLGSSENSNFSSGSSASWTFRKAPKFFTCVQYTGTGPGSAANEQQVSHDLGAKPGIVIIKRTDATGDWWVFTDVIDGSNDYGYLNQTAAFGNSGNNVATDSVFSVGGVLNTSGATYTAYLFANNDGDGGFGPDGSDIIKCGSYTGTGTAGNFVDLGFEPQWVLIKVSSSSDPWVMEDNMRGMPAGGSPNILYANGSNPESDGGFAAIDLQANGFSLRGTDNSVNASGQTYIYIAIRRGPLVKPKSATEVFSVEAGDNSGPPAFTPGFPVDFALIKTRDATNNWNAAARLTQGKYLKTNTTDAQASGSSYQFDYSDGFFNNSLGSNSISWMWKRAPNFFDVVAYSGNNTQGRSVSHNLGVAPEMIWVKARNFTRGWNVYHKDLTPSGGQAPFMELNATDAVNHDNSRYPSAPTATDFILGSNEEVNSGNYNYIAYLFASLPGISKVGSYTGNGSSQTIDCGFTSGARFVLIKRTDDTADWIVYDTARGIVTGNEPHLYLNRTDAEVTNDLIDPDPSGFIIDSYFADWNASGGNYIFYAIA